MLAKSVRADAGKKCACACARAWTLRQSVDRETYSHPTKQKEIQWRALHAWRTKRWVRKIQLDRMQKVATCRPPQECIR